MNYDSDHPEKFESNTLVEINFFDGTVDTTYDDCIVRYQYEDGKFFRMLLGTMGDIVSGATNIRFRWEGRLYSVEEPESSLMKMYSKIQLPNFDPEYPYTLETHQPITFYFSRSIVEIEYGDCTVGNEFHEGNFFPLLMIAMELIVKGATNIQFKW